MDKTFCLKSGDYLSSRRLTASTFGVKELNFCVRNGNRWNLFAIITAMVIYSHLCVYILLLYVLFHSFPEVFKNALNLLSLRRLTTT